MRLCRGGMRGWRQEECGRLRADVDVDDGRGRMRGHGDAVDAVEDRARSAHVLLEGGKDGWGVAEYIDTF